MEERNLRHYAPPVLLLGIMLALMLGSYWNDSATFDEKAHIPAGYANLFLGDYRLNPEHPPVVKALAALPLVFIRPNFPTDVASWRDAVNGQWDQGQLFLYGAGNNADHILRLARLPIILLAVFFGWLLWRWTEKKFDRRAANLTLFFYAFSPTFLAHSRLVTTDLGASFAFFIGIAAFLKFLDRPSWKNVFLAGLALGLAELIKFSLILLIPIYALLIIIAAVTRTEFKLKEFTGVFLKLTGKAVVVGAVGLVLIWAVYTYATFNYPAEKQLSDTAAILGVSPLGRLADFNLFLVKTPFLRPLGQYLLGVLMVIQRSGGGNTTYYWGEISAAGWRSYFPMLYLFKEPLAFHILSLTALGFAVRRIKNAKVKSRRKFLEWLRAHPIETASFVFIAAYWLSSVSSRLNLGIRHVLPTFPFIYLLVAKEISGWLAPRAAGRTTTWPEWLRGIWQRYITTVPRRFFVSGMILWQALSVAYVFPAFLSYYNKLAPLAARAAGAAVAKGNLPLTGLDGGLENGYLVAVDSNYDWGQDLKRL
ncbi:MAG: glycosyltransferase family 39 protein, partial [Candidatus Sungbacteria bacterium]|nr:glycosyltransferase family 39 protein [Candidatus Sungbacteria bacterium]